MKSILILASALALSGCALGAGGAGTVAGGLAASLGLAQNVVAAGQLVCTADGIYAALSTPVADPISVKDQTAAFVQAACATWKPNAMPVAPPAGAVVVAATVPAPTQ